MPVNLINKIEYQSPFWQFNGHIQSIYPSILRKVSVPYNRERIDLPDGDFLDLDWSIVAQSNKKLVIVTHGLEGDSTRHYVTGMVQTFNEQGYDGLGWNCRSCSGEINRVPRFYHHGDAEDLRFVLEYAITKGYQEIVLVGFSMGGSLTLRLLGEKPSLLPKELKKAIAFSVPLDLLSSVRELAKKGKRFYMNRFLKKLGVKIQQKSLMFPDVISYEGYDNIKNFDDFDNRYTAPLHGYKNAEDFYKQASVKPLLKNIEISTLIVQAANDPFLTAPCLELGEANNKENILLEITEHGGHVGFMIANSKKTYAEKRAWEFVKEL